MQTRAKVLWGIVVVALVLLVINIAGCGSDAPPEVESDSSQQYKQGSSIPVDDNVYTVTGQVVGDVSSLTRQSEPAEGYVYGSQYGMAGSYFGPQFDGKGFVRLFVFNAVPSTPLAPPENIIIVKTSDTKASVLLPGDVVTFKCRAQYEAVAAVRMMETFVSEKVETWEMDYCRLASPVIQVK